MEGAVIARAGNTGMSSEPHLRKKKNPAKIPSVIKYRTILINLKPYANNTQKAEKTIQGNLLGEINNLLTKNTAGMIYCSHKCGEGIP